MKKNEFFATWSGLHGGAQIVGIVKAWLSISYYAVKPLAKIGVTANNLTILGLFFGILVYLNSGTIWAIVFLVFSLIFDGIDGSLAILKGQSSRLGALLDSVVDRATELFWFLALYKLGINVYFLLFIFTLASVQEYIRARAGGLGFTEVGVVTPTERPVRASFIFVILIAFQLQIQVVDQIFFFWAGLQIFSILLICRVVFKKLR